jgi:urea transport system permease protein
MPVAFARTALVGAVPEMAVIRRLASRPLDTLLATGGAERSFKL